MKAIGYLRVSTDEQADSGLGLAAQQEAIRAEADRRGWELEFLADEGFTARNTKRPRLQEALAKLDSGESQTLLVAKLDRLSRSLIDFAGLMKRSQDNGWSIVCLDLNVDTTTPAGEMVANIMATFAQYEARLISQRTKDALAEKKRQGVRLGRPPEVPEGVVELIRGGKRANLSNGAIARFLTEQGIPTARGAEKWAPETVRVICRREELV